MFSIADITKVIEVTYFIIVSLQMYFDMISEVTYKNYTLDHHILVH